MSEEEPEELTEADQHTAALSAEHVITAGLTATVIRASRSVGDQTWSVEYGQWQLDYEQATHRMEQEKKDNDLRRLCFKIILGLLVAAFFATAYLGFFHTDQSVRPVAQNAFTTLLGGFVGALAGYFSAKAGA
jgi:hypothetical protein